MSSSKVLNYTQIVLSEESKILFENCQKLFNSFLSETKSNIRDFLRINDDEISFHMVLACVQKSMYEENISCPTIDFLQNEENNKEFTNIEVFKYIMEKFYLNKFPKLEDFIKDLRCGDSLRYEVENLMKDLKESSINNLSNLNENSLKENLYLYENFVEKNENLNSEENSVEKNENLNLDENSVINENSLEKVSFINLPEIKEISTKIKTQKKEKNLSIKEIENNQKSDILTNKKNMKKKFEISSISKNQNIQNNLKSSSSIQDLQKTKSSSLNSQENSNSNLNSNSPGVISFSPKNIQNSNNSNSYSNNNLNESSFQEENSMVLRICNDSKFFNNFSIKDNNELISKKNNISLMVNPEEIENYLNFFEYFRKDVKEDLNESREIRIYEARKDLSLYFKKKKKINSIISQNLDYPNFKVNNSAFSLVENKEKSKKIFVVKYNKDDEIKEDFDEDFKKMNVFYQNQEIFSKHGEIVKKDLNEGNNTENLLFRCKYNGCKKIYRTKENLILHIRNKHFKEKPYICRFCGQKYSHRSGKDIYFFL